MTEHTVERREQAAADFRAVGGRWHEVNGLTDSRGPLWLECSEGCHRLRTITPADDSRQWRCDTCGWSGPPHGIWLAQTDLLVDLCDVPDCPGAVRRALSDCGSLLNEISLGNPVAVAHAADAARRALRVLDLWGFHEDWSDEVV